MNRYVGELPSTVTIGAVILANIVLVVSLLFAYHPNNALISNVLPSLAQQEQSCLLFIDGIVVPNVGGEARMTPLHPRHVDGIIDGFPYALRNTVCSAWTIVDHFFWFLGLFLKLLRILALPHEAMTRAASALFGTTVRYIQSEAQQSASASPAHWQQSVLRNKEQQTAAPRSTRDVKLEELRPSNGVTVSYAKYHLRNGEGMSSQCEVEMLTVNDVKQIEVILDEDSPLFATSSPSQVRLDMIVTDAFDFDHHVKPNTPIDIYDVVRRTMVGQRNGGGRTPSGLSVALVASFIAKPNKMTLASETFSSSLSNGGIHRSGVSGDYMPLSLVHIHGDFDMVDGAMIADAISVATWQNKQELLLSLMAKFLDDDARSSSVGEEDNGIAHLTKSERFRLVIDIRGSGENGDTKSSVKSKLTPLVVETMREDMASSIADYLERRRAQTSLPESLTASKKATSIQESPTVLVVDKYLPATRIINAQTSGTIRSSAHMVPYVSRASQACERSGAISGGSTSSGNPCNVVEIGDQEIAISSVYSPLLAYLSLVDTSTTDASSFLPTRSTLDAGMSRLSMALDNDVWDGAIGNDMMFACWYNLFHSSLAMELDAESADDRALEMYRHFDRACPSPTNLPPSSSSTANKKFQVDSPFLSMDFMSSQPNQFDDGIRRLFVISSKDDSAVSAQSWMSSMVASLFPNAYSDATSVSGSGEDVLTSLSSRRKTIKTDASSTSSKRKDMNNAELGDTYIASQFLSDDQLRTVGLHMLKSCRTVTTQASNSPSTTTTQPNKSGKRGRGSARDAQLIEDVFGKRASANQAETAAEHASPPPFTSHLPRPYDNRRMSYGACVTGAHSLAWHRYWYAHNNSLTYVRRMHEMDKCFADSSITTDARSTSFTFYRRSSNDPWAVRDLRGLGDGARKSTLFNKIKAMFPATVTTDAPHSAGLYEVVEEEDVVEEIVATTILKRTATSSATTDSAEACATRILDTPAEHFLINKDDGFAWWQGSNAHRDPSTHVTGAPLLVSSAAAKSSGVFFMQQSKYEERCLESASVISGRSLQVEKDCMFDRKTRAYMRHTLASLDSK